MNASSKNAPGLFLPLVAILFLLVATSPAITRAAVSCSDVVNDLKPCLSYLTSGSGKPPAACCKGVSALAAATSTAADRKTACECVKSSAKNVKVKADLVKALPSNCGVTSPVPLSPNVDCSKIG